MKKIGELRNKTDKELKDMAEAISLELCNLRFKKVTDVVESPAYIRSLKKERAQILTLLSERKVKTEPAVQTVNVPE